MNEQALRYYHLGGLRIASPLVLPGVSEYDPESRGPDVTITIRVGTSTPTESSYSASGNILEICAAGVSRSFVRAGSEVQIERSSAASDDDVRLFLLGSAMGALHHQRGALPLHASAIAVGGACVAFVGPPGAGKSTLSAFLSRRGYSVLSDDVCVVTVAAGGIRVHGGAAYLRLRADALTELRSEPAQLLGDRACFGKYQLRVDECVQTEPLPIRAIYALSEVASGTSGRLVRTSGGEALRLVLENVYRPHYSRSMGSLGCTFNLAASVANTVGIYRLHRPMTFNHMENVLRLLDEHWSGGRN